MKSLIIIIILIFSSTAYSQSWQWSIPIALTDSVSDNISLSFVNADYFEFLDYNYLLWERNFGDSSSIILLKPSQPNSEVVICRSDSGIRFTNPIGQLYIDSTIFVIWQSNENENYDLFGGFCTGSRLTGIHQITTNSLDDVNPSLSGEILVWEREGKIITKNITIIDTALFLWDVEVAIDSVDCTNSVVTNYEKFIAYEKMIQDSSSIFITWISDSVWHNPVCLFAQGDNRSLSIDKGYSSALFWQNYSHNNWNLKGCQVHKMINDTIIVYDTTTFNFSDLNDMNPTGYSVPAITSEMDNVISPLFAFESDSTNDLEIFVNNEIYYPNLINISQNSGPDVIPQLSQAGWLEAVYGDFRVWLVWQSHRNGHWQIWGSFADITLMGIEGESNVSLNKYQLFQNYPNPFNSQTSIEYYLPQSGQVKIEIYNVLGQKIKTFINYSQKSGIHQVIWDGRNENNIAVSSGVYIYNLTVDQYSFSKKLLMLK